MSKTALPIAVLLAAAGVLVAGDARAAPTTHRAHAPRAIHFAASESAADAAGKGVMRFTLRRGTTLATATFTHLAPDAVHTVEWTGDDGSHAAQFVSDHHGRGRMRNVAVPQDAMTEGDPSASVIDDQGMPVLDCTDAPMHDPTADPPATPPSDPPPMDPPHAPPAMNPPAHSGCSMGGSMSCCTQCTANGATCDPTTCTSNGCSCSCCCGGSSGSGGSGSSGGSGMSGGSGSSSGSSGGMMGGSSGSTSGGPSGTSGGMMHR